MNVIKFTCNTRTTFGCVGIWIEIYTSFELERFGNDCSVKVIGKDQVECKKKN